jgi:hypothetical protein
LPAAPHDGQREQQTSTPPEAPGATLHPHPPWIDSLWAFIAWSICARLSITVVLRRPRLVGGGGERRQTAEGSRRRCNSARVQISATVGQVSRRGASQ